MHAQMQPQIIPRIRLVPHNPYFPVMEREVTKTLKFGRQVIFFFSSSLKNLLAPQKKK